MLRHLPSSVLGLLLLLLCGLASPVHALRGDKSLHHYVRASWSIQDGLPQISALAIAQDRQGYVWIGTQSGLARFDGVRFVSFTPELEPALPGVWIRSLHVARDGRLWVGTYKGVAVRDGHTFTSVPAVDATRWPGLEVHGFVDDPSGTVFVATSQGLFREKGGTLQPVAGSPEVALSLLHTPDGLWVGSRGSVHVLRAGHWTKQGLPPDAAGAGVVRLVAAQGTIWAGTALGLLVRHDGRWQRPGFDDGLGHSPVDMLYADSAGDLWAGGDAGLARIRANDAFDFVAPAGPGGVPGLRAAFEDREGNLWLGSQIEGLIRLRDSWTRRYSTPEGLHDRIVWSLAPDPDGTRIWVGSSDGVSVFDGERFKQVVRGDVLPHPNGYNLLAERDRLWIGTRRGLVVMEHGGPKAGEVQVPALLAGIALGQVNGIVRESDGGLWIATTSGLYLIREGRLRHYAAEDGLTDPRIRFFHRAADGRVLLGTPSGLFEMRGELFREFGPEQGLPPNLDVTVIADVPGGLAIGTLSEQSYLFKAGRWHALGVAQGLPANSAFFLSVHRGYLWAGGIRGITRVPLADLDAFASGTVASVRGEMLLNERGDSRSGQQGYCCNGAGNAKGFRRGETLWLPSRDGIVALDTNAIRQNPVRPGVVIERVRVNEQWHSAEDLRAQDLPTEARDLSFEFTVLSYQDPRSVGIEYRLVGYDKKWRTGDPTRRSAHYTSLPAGRYEFQVRGSNNSGVAAAQAAALAFRISPHFHETPWFFLLVALLLAALVFAGYKLQQHRFQQQRNALELLVSQRTADLETANLNLKEASDTDPLTGLRNRRYMTGQLPGDLAYYDRRASKGEHVGDVMAFALVDLDHFKQVNDRHGHFAGDRALTQLAHVLRDLVRTGDYVVRWGGEEFLVVFRPMPADHTAMVANRLCAAVAAHRIELESGDILGLTCSVGLAEYPLTTQHQGPVAWEGMIELADFALYHVKHHGRDGWTAFKPLERAEIPRLLGALREDPAAVFADAGARVFGNVGKLRPDARREEAKPNSVG